MIEYLLTVAWSTYIIAYCLRFCSPWFSSFLNYGFRDDGKMHQSTHVKWVHVLFMWHVAIPKSLHWRFMYGFASVYNLILCCNALTLPSSSTSVFPLMYQIQLLRRFYECLFVHNFSTTGSGSIVRILPSIAGIGFYVLACPTILLASQQMNSISWKMLLIFSIIFSVASWYQNKCHKILANVPKERTKAGNTIYRFPFNSDNCLKYLSCPHYFCEIIIYLNFALILALEATSIAVLLSLIMMLVFVVLNLSFTGWQTHLLYKRQEEQDTNLNRKTQRWAIIPFIL